MRRAFLFAPALVAGLFAMGCSGDSAPLGETQPRNPTEGAQPSRRTFTTEGVSVVTMTEIEAAEQARGGPLRAGRAMPRPLPTPHSLSTEGEEAPSQEHFFAPPEAPSPPALAPTLGASFLGLGDDNSSIPPDTHGAVGPSHVLTTLNTQVRVQDRTGAVISTVSLDAFWASLGNPSPFDPKVAYDPSIGRFLFTACADSKSASSSLLMGMSQSSDPSGAWSLYRIDADPGNALWLDFPSLGFNATWAAVQVNVYDIAANGFNRADFFLFDKADLAAGAASVDLTVLSDTNVGGTVVPAETYDPGQTTLHLLQSFFGPVGLLRLFTVTGSVGTEQLQPVGFVQGAVNWSFEPPSSGADSAPQLGSAALIQNNDDRLGNVVLRNGSLWTAQTAFLPSNAPTRSAVQWWQIATDGTVLQNAMVDDPTGAQFFAFPSIAVNKDDDALIGYSRFSATQFASANYSFRSGFDPLGTLQPDTVLKAGEAKYVKTFGGARNRWGDYSHTVVDPVDDTALWTIQEYASTPFGGADRWGTWWGQVIPTPLACGPDGAPCDDSNACTQVDTCQAGVCVGASPVSCVASDACHAAGVCDVVTGLCSNPVAPNGTSCSDGNACTQLDACQAGVCTGGGPVVCSALDTCHSPGTCDAATGACDNPIKPNGSVCNDGNGCTQPDACQAGICVGGAPTTCIALDACHTPGTCDPFTGACNNPPKADGSPCSDGNACTQVDSCQAGMCTGGIPLTCSALDACHVAGTCDAVTGVCNNPNKANGSPCDDGNACTTVDTCQSGACVGASPVTCVALDACHSPGTCNASTGLCDNPIAADGSPCSDGSACTQGDTCQGGLCVGGPPVTCTALDQCHVAGVCNAVTGVCDNPQKPNSTPCDDGSACTLVDACQSGVCLGASPVVCAPSDTCHVAGKCDAATGVCDNPIGPDGKACSDGDACTQGDVCLAGVCKGQGATVCTPLDACHVAGVCDSVTGLCDNPVAPSGTPCNDGNACTLVDQCAGGVCSGSNPVVCTATDNCHVAGTCNPGSGVCDNPLKADGAACDDGDLCTQIDSCSAGACKGVAVACAPSDECHLAGTCDAASGTCDSPAAPDGTPCSEGFCAAGQCQPETTGQGGGGGQGGSGQGGTGGQGGSGQGGTGGQGGSGEGGDGGSGGQGGKSAGGAGPGGSGAGAEEPSSPFVGPDLNGRAGCYCDAGHEPGGSGRWLLAAGACALITARRKRR